MKFISSAAGVVLAVVAMTGSGDTLPLSVRIHWPGPDEASRPEVSIHASGVDARAGDLDFAAKQNPSVVSLPKGQWFVAARAPGYWSDPQLVVISDEPLALTLDLLPATRLRAVVRFVGSVRPAEVVVHVQTVVATDPFRIKTRSIVCPVSNERIECVVPAGTQDLVFRAPGFASVYRWNADLARRTSDVGRLEFRRGSTLSGRIEFASRAAAASPVDVSVIPARAAAENDELSLRKSLSRLVARPNSRGFFVFNLEPGRYTVRATTATLVSQEEEATVVDGREAVVQNPLRLDSPRKLAIAVHPPLDPWNKPWKVTLSRFDADGVVVEERRATLPVTGTYRWEDQATGSYSLRVRRSDIDEWYRTAIDLDHDQVVDLPVPTVRVRGTVRLADEPIAAWLIFRLAGRGLRVPVRSAPDGTFLTILPSVPGNRWDAVEIAADGPRLMKTVKDVELRGADDGDASLDLRLSSCSLAGTIVADDGTSVSHALVNIAGPSGELHQVESDAGDFAVTGLDPGQYAISAATRDAESEAPVEVSLVEGEALKEVTLVVKPVGRLRGVVRSPIGPVMNAAVFVTPARSESPVLNPVPVDATGAFEVRVPPHTDELTVSVAAPGFAFRMFRMPMPRTGETEIAVDQSGGSLTLDAPTAEGALRPFVVHDGTAISASALAYLAGARVLSNLQEKISFIIPQIEAGTYSLCWLATPQQSDVPSSRCASGALAIGGTLMLRAPQVTAK